MAALAAMSSRAQPSWPLSQAKCRAGNVQSRDAVLRCLIDGGVGGDEQPCAAIMALRAGKVQRRVAVLRCLIDGGVGGDEQ
eukprot:4395058-Prymnesium_polylepis.1